MGETKYPVPGLGYILLNSWPKGSHENVKTTQAIVKAIGSSSLTVGKSLLLNTAAILLIEYEGV